MANFTYNVFKEDAMTGAYNILTSTIKVALVTSSYTPNKSHTIWHHTDVSGYEIQGATAVNYTAGGETITNKTVALDGNEAVFDSTVDVEWASSTITASGAVVYEAATDHLITYIDFGQNQTSSLGTFAIQWSDQGIVRLGDA